MKFRFDATQPHQRRAIDAVVGLFRGQRALPPEVEFADDGDALLPVVSNRLTLDDDALLENLRREQDEHNNAAVIGCRISPDGELAKIAHAFADDGRYCALAGCEVAFPNFSVEMETGTGKTYAFLRTMRELAQHCGFFKFIIIVPSIAIREGILHALKSTAAHFARHYPEAPLSGFGYESAKLAKVRDFACATEPRAMVMTIDSFKREGAIFRRDSDSIGGDVPLRLIQAVRPILVLDEPQNMESELSVESLALLNPLFTLRYSATHKKPYNLVYRLSPAEAYRRGLVKKIKVGEVAAKHPGAAYIRLRKVSRRGSAFFAHLELNVFDGTRVKAKTVRFMQDEDIGEKVRLPEYEGMYVRDMYDETPEKPAKIELNDGRELAVGEEIGGVHKELLRAQITMTLREHFRRQRKLRGQGIKVLSLFFIDRVDNYLPPDSAIRGAFEECFDREKKEYAEWRDIPAAAVHNGYFAQKGGNAEADAARYRLIMQDKESLLTFPADSDDDQTRAKRQVAFIFSHSALREGWDNPNIFQICALKDGGGSEMRKRQEIGRGLRLAVNQSGERVAGDEINQLAVIVNESFADYVKGYQWEIAQDQIAAIEEILGKPLAAVTDEEREELIKIHGKGIIPPSPSRLHPPTARVNRNHLWRTSGDPLSPQFAALWERIKHKTRYTAAINEEKLIGQTAKKIKAAAVPKPAIKSVWAKVNINKKGAFAAQAASGSGTLADLHQRRPLPDAAALAAQMLQNGHPPMMITRATMVTVFRKTADESALKNPAGWAALAARAVRDALGELLAEDIKYEKINGEFYEWRELFREEQEIAAEFVAEVKKSAAAYDLIPCDAENEKKFAEDLAAREDVKFFCKLPREFVVPTPVGNYNPDWAVLLEEERGDKLYFVAETKDARAVDDDGYIDEKKLRGAEGLKIKCAARHFGSKQLGETGALDGVDYKVVNSAAQIGAAD